MLINAKTARSLASLPKQVEKIANKIKEEAERGEPGVWINWTISFELHQLLHKDYGYEITYDHNKTWIWWGNS